MSGRGGSNQSSILQTLVKKILTHLDETSPEKLNAFLGLFSNANNWCKIVFNSNAIAQPMLFLQMWQEQVVQTQHSLTSIDYHVIPGANSLICNVGCKVRFDESGRNKMGQDSIVNGVNSGFNNGNIHTRPRPIWGSNYGVTIQIVMEDRIFKNDFNGVICSFSYKMVYKPDDSLMSV